MNKPFFSTFRQPAFDLPKRPSTSGNVRLLTLSNPKMINPESLPKTSAVSIKSSIQEPKPRRPTSTLACQADFQDEIEKQIEKEVLTEPTMKFLQVSDYEPGAFPVQSSDGYLRFPTSSGNFLKIEEVSLNQAVQKFQIKQSTPPVQLKPAEKKEEKIETQDFYLKIAEEKLKRIEEETYQLEQDMKLQNEQLDKLEINIRDTAEQERKELVTGLLDKMTQENFEEDRLGVILAKNQILYERIERALTPKVEFHLGEEMEVQRKVEFEQNAGGNPVINRRMAAAMSTAAKAIEVSRRPIKPAILKKPVK